MKKILAFIIAVSLVAASSLTVFAADSSWGFEPLPGEQGVDGWYIMYSRDQVNSGSALNPVNSKEMVYSDENASWMEAWHVPVDDLPEGFEFWDIWTDIGAVWNVYDGNEPWGQVRPWGIDAAVIIKWVPSQDGVYNLNALIPDVLFDQERDVVDGCYISVHKNSESLYFAEFDGTTNASGITAFAGELELTTSDALYFSVDPKVGNYDETVVWELTLTRTGDVLGAGSSPDTAVAPEPSADTGVSSLITFAVVGLIFSGTGFALLKKKP